MLVRYDSAARRGKPAGVGKSPQLHARCDLRDRYGGVIRHWNRGAEERYGWTAEQAVGKVVHDLLKTVFPAPVEEIKAGATRTGRWEDEILHTTKDGAQMAVASRWALQRDARGAPVAILETNNDITERKWAEAELRDCEERFRTLGSGPCEVEACLILRFQA